jgi:hypothetical protein
MTASWLGPFLPFCEKREATFLQAAAAAGASSSPGPPPPPCPSITYTTFSSHSSSCSTRFDDAQIPIDAHTLPNQSSELSLGSASPAAAAEEESVQESLVWGVAGEVRKEGEGKMAGGRAGRPVGSGDHTGRRRRGF